ncbi:multi-copy leucine-rich repeat protein, putative [Bodo saltans]|uniref:Multi-copy leucine-rich repeat protein, putative n=1 Tax=Bodo saltans TaxID=75058 RepID=A0A0S4JF00_BODSA|nr:multi-copy leucine-rich repeat protein, putative [Bodo saltans]|eukprot:CUG88001.1 multi-copy leucine-rich repeat protein, putative [Bodo saltans]
MRRWVQSRHPIMQWFCQPTAEAIRATASTPGPQQTSDALHQAIVECLSKNKLKSGTVFAYLGNFEEMRRYADEIEAARGELVSATGCALSDVLTVKEIESLADKHGLKKIMRPECSDWTSLIPTDSVHADVRAHVEQRRNPHKHDTSVLCNYGPSGSGKSVQLLHTTAVATQIIGGMVRRGVSDDVERERCRPLGFCVSFTRHDGTGSYKDRDELTPPSGQLLILTAIALRMAFAVMERSRYTSTPDESNYYSYFVDKMIDKCDMTNDKGNFDSIVAALRQVLKWEGPMFIAVDSFLRAFDYKAPAIATGFSTVCRELLDESPVLPISSSEETGPVIYERYLAISSFYPVHAVDFAAKANRRLIMQPTALLDLCDISRAFAHGTAVINVPPQYATLFASGHVGLTNEQLLFLIHLALSTGLPQEVSSCLQQHRHDVPGKKYGGVDDFVTHMLWLRSGSGNLSSITENMCVCACELVVGLVNSNIFMGDDSDRRAFALSERLEWDCFVSQTMPTRALVSPNFLSSVIHGWPESGKKRFMRYHVGNLRSTISKHAQMSFKLLEAAPHLVAPSNAELSRRLVQRWIVTTAVALGDLTFRALCLRFACALCAIGGATCDHLLTDVCSHIKSKKRFMRYHVGNLRSTISKHAQMSFKLLEAAPHLVAPSNAELSRRLVQRWIVTTAVALGDLTFRALCLRFACALCAIGGATCDHLLTDVCSHIKSDGGVFPDVQFSSGPLVVVSNIEVYPREYPYDDHYPYDDEHAKFLAKKERDEFEALLVASKHTSGSLHVADSSQKQEELQNTVDVLREVAEELMPSQCCFEEVHKSPYERIQVALAKGDHFSIQPREVSKVTQRDKPPITERKPKGKPTKKSLSSQIRTDQKAKPIFHWSDDGVMFLREKGAEWAWVVFLVQAARDIAQCSHTECKESHHITEACRMNLAPLPSNITDADGKVHTLRYVKILVTADPIEHESKSSDVGSDLPKDVIAVCFMDIDTIKTWCPTVGMFAGNLEKIRQLAGAP